MLRAPDVGTATNPDGGGVPAVQLAGVEKAYGLTKKQTLERIGQHFGITRERVRQIEKAALAKLKVKLVMKSMML